MGIIVDRASEGKAMPTLPDNDDKFIDQACHAVFAQCDGGRMGKEVSVVFLKSLIQLYSAQEPFQFGVAVTALIGHL